MSSKKAEEEKQRDERIEQTGQLTLEKHGEDEKAIHMITIIGEIEGHDNLGSSSKTTKYEHILPQLAAIEDSSQIEGLLVLLNTMGGDVEAGLAIAEMIASLSKPTVSPVSYTHLDVYKRQGIPHPHDDSSALHIAGIGDTHT